MHTHIHTRTRARVSHHTHVYICLYIYMYKHTRCGMRDASRAAALNYRSDAILMRSIIYGARHRPLNIPRPTKESLRDPGIIPGPEYYSRTVGGARTSAQGTYSRRYFRRRPNGVRRERAPPRERHLSPGEEKRFRAVLARIDFTGRCGKKDLPSRREILAYQILAHQLSMLQ